MRTPVIIALWWLALGPNPFAQQFQYVQLDVPNAVLTRPFGVNAAGQIVGLYRDSRGASHGFLREPDDTYTTLDYPGAIFTNATGINARGEIVGRWTDANGINHAYVRTPHGLYIGFDPAVPCVPGTSPTVAHGVNDIGEIMGRCFDASVKELGWLRRRDGTFTILDDPSYLTVDAWTANNRGLVGGDYTDVAGFVHGYLWTEVTGFLTVDVANNQTGIRSINERGDVTGIYGNGVSRFHGFLLRDGVFTVIDYPGSIDNGPGAGTLVINNSGLILGGFIDANGREHGFMARECPPPGCQ
jgi:uncharacterized membrane protein